MSRGLLGTEFAAALRRIDSSLPIILCSGYFTEELTEEIARHRLHALLMKPVDMVKLVQSVRQVLDSAT